MSGIEIQQFEFEQSPYVLIHVAVGTNTPPRVFQNNLKSFRKNSRLCQLLDSLDIPCDIVPVRVDSFQYPDQPQPQLTDDMSEKFEELGDNIEELEAEIEDAKCEALCGIDELRDELVTAKVLPEGPSLEDFGIELKNAGLITPGLFFNDSPRVKPRELTTEKDHQYEQIMKFVTD